MIATMIMSFVLGCTVALFFTLFIIKQNIIIRIFGAIGVVLVVMTNSILYIIATDPKLLVPLEYPISMSVGIVVGMFISITILFSLKKSLQKEQEHSK